MTTATTSKRRATLALAALALAAAGCAWSVPADPGRNALLRSTPGAPAAATPPREASAAFSDEGARALYQTRCSQCHEPFPPTHATAAQWPALVRRYGPRAGLFGEERERVLRWLQANSR